MNNNIDICKYSYGILNIDVKCNHLPNDFFTYYDDNGKERRGIFDENSFFSEEAIKWRDRQDEIREMLYSDEQKMYYEAWLQHGYEKNSYI